MERIGIAASKIAKGNLFLYNFFVVLIAFLFSFLVFFIAGSSIVIVLIVIAYISSDDMLPDLQSGWMQVMLICLICLAVVAGLFTLFAIDRNKKFKRN